jgi:hypothetical protein
MLEGETFMVLDAGGGTVDITVHKVCGANWARTSAGVLLLLLRADGGGASGRASRCVARAGRMSC